MHACIQDCMRHACVQDCRRHRIHEPSFQQADHVSISLPRLFKLFSGSCSKILTATSARTGLHCIVGTQRASLRCWPRKTKICAYELAAMLVGIYVLAYERAGTCHACACMHGGIRAHHVRAYEQIGTCMTYIYVSSYNNESEHGDASSCK